MPRLVKASYVRRTNTSLVLLDCKHTLIFKMPFPVPGDDLWCLRCGRDALVVEVNVEYRVICEDCSKEKRFGLAKELCLRFGVQHRRKNPGHVVRIYLGEEILHRFGMYEMPTLPMAVGESPPF